MNVPDDVSKFLDEMVQRSIEDDRPPENSFTARQFADVLKSKDPTATSASAAIKLDKLVASGEIEKMPRQYLVNSRRVWCYRAKTK